MPFGIQAPRTSSIERLTIGPKLAIFGCVLIITSVLVIRLESMGRRNIDELGCVRCDMLFTRLEGSPSGKRSQYVAMQLRGEAKSGTSMMHEWASGALYHACNFLKRSYGEHTCRMSWTSETEEDALKGKFTNRTLTFEPHRGGAGARCSCDDVDRVVISVSKRQKHTLPVEPSCRYWHPNTIAAPNSDSIPCRASGYTDLWQCIQEANCTINDNRLQFVVMRDPRPMAVSAYFHRILGGNIKEGTVKETYIKALLPPICAWLAAREILFAGTLSTSSTIYWFEDTLAEPLAFHQRWLESIGLHLPAEVVRAAKDAALRRDFEFFSKGIDEHPGGEEANSGRSWKDEISPDLVSGMNRIVALWLPPTLQAKLATLEEPR